MGDVLFLAHRVPYPPDRGDKIRSFHVLKHLAARRPVHLIAFADGPGDLAHDAALAPLTASRSIVRRTKSQAVAALEALVTGRPLSLAAFAHDGLRRSVEQVFARHSIDTVFVFSGQMAQYLPEPGDAREIMDFVDMDSAKFAAYADEARGPMRWMLAREARLLMRHEQAVAARVDASLFVSDAEAGLFRARTRAQRVHAIENGIDTGHFDPAAAFDPAPVAGTPIVFTGQMDYRPNIEAVTWFAEAILPQIRRAHPSAQFAIVGRNPTEAVRALARHAGVTVTGEVADVRGWLASAAVAVAPLKLARGIQNKVLEAMAMARPVVASTAAAEGIDHDATIRVGGTAREIAAAVNALLSDRAGAAELGAAARRRVQARYSWEACLKPLDALMGLRAEAGDVPAPARRSAA